MNKIIYLFGAGASRGAVPIINEIPGKIKECIELLQREEFQLSVKEFYSDLKLNRSKREIQLYLINDLKWLLSASSLHASIDTFAKKLFLKGDDESLRRLKAAFSVFLNLEQCQHRPDNRYDIFYASVLKGSYLNFPDNIRIVSWNYDSQFEIAFSEYSENYEISYNQKLLNIFTPNLLTHSSESKFAIYKLNGSTSIHSRISARQFMYVDKITKTVDIKIIEAALRNYASYIFSPKEVFTTLSFAWEEKENEESIVNQTINAIKDGSILVVIGYSFPYFNREVDKMIINSMGKLSKVYFQSPEAKIIKERFQSICTRIDEKDLVLKEDTGQFLLPNEL